LETEKSNRNKSLDIVQPPYKLLLSMTSDGNGAQVNATANTLALSGTITDGESVPKVARRSLLQPASIAFSSNASPAEIAPALPIYIPSRMPSQLSDTGPQAILDFDEEANVAQDNDRQAIQAAEDAATYFGQIIGQAQNQVMTAAHRADNIATDQLVGWHQLQSSSHRSQAER